MSATGSRTAYLGARLLDPASGLDAPGALLTEGTRIADLGPRLFADGVPEGIEAVDCAGRCLAPGLVDMRVQLREPGEEHKETIQTAGRAAAAGGVTSVAALPNTDPVVDDVAGVEFVARRARDVKLVKVYTYGALTRRLEGAQMTELGLLSSYGAVGFTDGVKPVANAQVLRRALSYASAFDVVIAQQPQEPTLATGSMNAGELATRLGLSGIPVMAEVIMLERDLRLAELTGGRYHAANISTEESIKVIRAAKARGIRVTCDTAPHYFILNETAVGDYRTFAKVLPPLRSEADRQAVAEAVADGTIDAIASDHSPHDQDSKRLPFVGADFGIVGLETLLPLALELNHKGSLSLLDLLDRLTRAPSEILGLEAGCLKAGQPADLVIFDAERPWRIDPEAFRSKSKNSPFEDHPVQGKALRTVVDGRTIFEAETDGGV
ncbi:MAG: dihydroorotase [Rhodospirillales bacterium]|nr:dihydroorotase [Rhodospirillales bacterium]MDH3913120.1 dihydroorotase [Rhodospirillales bacterium]MDH3918566.1 dihydroorotase [Rhodospirillales bacterium]MDH3966802.1 dihydroorotase [Rhodospirillales bacterium]